ncbi:MAG: DNA repair protein RecN [Candidatus Omnitrophica bacterium]|nr:DNA repair protein RecN [Candidatus Omnitrophota bacterium]
MLTQLTIQNFGLIDSLSIDFEKGLNVFTGETGAGKSILIDALRIALGERISPSLVREDTKACIIEAVFDLSKNELKSSETLRDFFQDKDFTLIINRTYSSDGKNKIKINGLNITLSQLKDVGNCLMDFHGPHDHQMLLSSSSHLGMLDRLTDFGKLLSDYANHYEGYVKLKEKLGEIEALASSHDRDLDLLSHQIGELKQVPLDEDKFQELLGQQTKVNNAEKLYDYIQKILSLLEAGDNSPGENIRQAFSPMRDLNQTDEKTAYLMESLSQLQGLNDQIIADLKDYADSISFDPSEAQEINAKCDIYDDIKRKYGPTLADAKIFFEEALRKHQLLSNLEQNDADLKKEIQAAEAALVQIAKKMTKCRQKTAENLKTTIEKELSELGIIHVQFEARIDKVELGASGQDSVTFYISPNAGEELKPLSEIVSSGEAARVMLALKKALIEVDPIPVLIFDEIDAQIGGRLGTVTGKKLKSLSSHRQVILITHLPQIASFADQHFKVLKMVKNGRTITSVEALDKNARVKELAKMMSGEKETQISLQHAEDLLSKATVSKK